MATPEEIKEIIVSTMREERQQQRNETLAEASSAADIIIQRRLARQNMELRDTIDEEIDRKKRLV